MARTPASKSLPHQPQESRKTEREIESLGGRKRERVPFIKKITPRDPTKANTRKPARLAISLIYLHYLSEAVDVVDIPLMLCVFMLVGMWSVVFAYSCGNATGTYRTKNTRKPARLTILVYITTI